MKDILFNALFKRGFTGSASMDIATLLEKTILRCDNHPSERDIDDLISVLQTVKQTLTK